MDYMEELTRRRMGKLNKEQLLELLVKLEKELSDTNSKALLYKLENEAEQQADEQEAQLMAKAKEYAAIHAKAWEYPENLGYPRKAWIDDDGIMCVKYSNAKIYHYQRKNGKLEWW